MTRVISSPSSSTTGLATLIFAIARSSVVGPARDQYSANSTSVLDPSPTGTPGHRREPVRAWSPCRRGPERGGPSRRGGTGTDHPPADGLPQPVRVRDGLPDRVALAVGGTHPQPHRPGRGRQGGMGDPDLVHTVADPGDRHRGPGLAVVEADLRLQVG